jgi:sulfur transfer complex TusBCD TusB component (DsrH family)
MAAEDVFKGGFGDGLSGEPQDDLDFITQQAAVLALQNVVIPLLKGNIEAKNMDKNKLNVSVMLIARAHGAKATRAHIAQNKIMAIRYFSGDDPAVAKALLLKHFNPTLELPEKGVPKKR